MSGFGGAGAFSDGKYNITNDFGGSLYEHIGKKRALELMRYVDQINMKYGGEGTRLYSTGNSSIKQICLQHGLHLLDAQVRHLGTDINYIVLENLFHELKDKADFHFNTAVSSVRKIKNGYEAVLETGETAEKAAEMSFQDEICSVFTGDQKLGFIFRNQDDSGQYRVEMYDAHGRLSSQHAYRSLYPLPQRWESPHPWSAVPS